MKTRTLHLYISAYDTGDWSVAVTANVWENGRSMDSDLLRCEWVDDEGLAQAAMEGVNHIMLLELGRRAQMSAGAGGLARTPAPVAS